MFPKVGILFCILDIHFFCLACFALVFKVLAKIQKHFLNFSSNSIHLMCAPEGNSEFCFPESLNVETRGKTKLTIS